MRWHSIILIAGVVLVVESAKRREREDSHDKKSHFTSVEDEDEREDSGNGHIFDVKKIVKGTIDAIGGQGTTPKPDPDGLYQLLNIPSQILTQIASDAGYIEPSTTLAPKKKRKRRNHKVKKYRKVSEDGSYEGTYVRVEDDEEEEEEEDSYKPRKKNKSKRRHHRPIYLPPNYVPPPMVSSSPLQSSLPTHQIPQQQPPAGMNIQRQQVPQVDPLTSIFAPLPFPVSQLPTFNLPTFAPVVPLTIPTTTTPVPPTMAPLHIRPVENISPLTESSGPQYAYQPVVQSDGKTYYQRVLIMAPIREGEPGAEVIMPTTAGMRETRLTTTTQASTTTKEMPSVFVTEEPTTTEGTKRKTKIRRRMIKNTQTENPLPAGAIQQLPQSDSLIISTTMRPVAITFSPNLELFQTKSPTVEISLQEEKEVKIKPRTHGTRTHSVGKAIESGSSNGGQREGLTTNEPSLRYIKDEDDEDWSDSSTSSSIPSIATPPIPQFSPKLITTQLPSIEQQMKNNEVFSVSLETAKKGSGTLSVPQVTALHSIANRRLQSEDDYLPPIDEKKRRKKTRKANKEKKEERIKKVEITEIEDIKEAVEAVRREKKEKVQRRFHAEEEKEEEEEKKEEEKKKEEKMEEEEEEEEVIATTTHKPKRRHHKKQREIPVETTNKIYRSSPEEETEQSSIPPASPSSSSFRRSLAPALIDVRELNDEHRTTPQSLRHVHHAERLAILRRSLEAKARGVKQLSSQDKEEEKDELLNDGEESKLSTPLSDLFPSTTTEIARKKTRRHRKKKTTVIPSTTTTTTTESPTTTAESEESYELNDEEYEEGDIPYEIDENGDKIVKTTTTKPEKKKEEIPSTTIPSKKLKVLRPHCLNIRSFARQFGMVDVFDFVEEHCSFIENYYPSLTCDRREEYLAYCAGVWDSTKL